LIKIVNKFPIQFFTLRCFFSKKPVYGFTLLFYWCPFPGKTLGILEKKGWKIILTYRKNVVDQALSHLVARNTNFWHRLPGKPAPEINKIYIAPPQFLDRFKTIYRVRKRENEIMKNFEHLKVVYESDLQHQENWDETAHRIFDYLGVNPAPLAASIKRTYDKPYSEIIENYDELVSALQKNNLPTSI
jgi:LPS sulfotransferase NodH